MWRGCVQYNKRTLKTHVKQYVLVAVVYGMKSLFWLLVANRMILKNSQKKKKISDQTNLNAHKAYFFKLLTTILIIMLHHISIMINIIYSHLLRILNLKNVI